jgi:hypothetical protein
MNIVEEFLGDTTDRWVTARLYRGPAGVFAIYRLRHWFFSSCRGYMVSHIGTGLGYGGFATLDHAKAFVASVATLDWNHQDSGNTFFLKKLKKVYDQVTGSTVGPEPTSAA